MSHEILFYFQDPGGSNFFGDVLGNINIPSNARAMVHPLSQHLIDKNIFSNFELCNQNLSKEYWLKYLGLNKIKRVISTLSSKYKDLSNCNLIEACNELDIETLGFLDHWKGFERLTSGNSLTYCPSLLGVIDDVASERAQSLGVDKQNIRTVGHPQLEKRLKTASFEKSFTHNNFNICLLSQPNTMDKSFLSIYKKREDDNELLDSIKNIIFRELPNSEFVLRQHPKENAISEYSRQIDISSWEDCLKKNQIFIGVSSITMLEAYLSGKIVIELAFKELPVRKNEIPYNTGCKVTNLKQFTDALKKIKQNRANSNNRYDEDLECALEMSAERLQALVLDFMSK